VADGAQRGERAVAVPGRHLGGAPLALRGLAGVRLGARSSALLPGQAGGSRRVGVVRRRERGGGASPAAVGPVAGRLRGRVAAFVGAGAVVPPLEGAVEVDADPVAGDPRVLVREREDEGGVVAEADPPLACAQAALGLAEEHHVGRQREVAVVLQRVAAEELRRLGHVVAARLPGGEKQTFVFFYFYRV